jgi:hypothetical protein
LNRGFITACQGNQMQVVENLNVQSAVKAGFESAVQWGSKDVVAKLINVFSICFFV